MKMVIDSNALQSIELRDHLSANKANVAVVPDFIFVEAYKSKSVAAVCKSMEILCEFPSQVIVLKPTMKCSGLVGREAGLQRRLIHQKQTSQFSSYARMLRRARDGDNSAIRSIEADFAAPTAHMDGLAQEAIGLGERIDHFVSNLSKEDRAAIRADRLPSEQAIRHAMKQILKTTRYVMETHPNVYQWPKAHELVNTFVFRACLCQVVLAMYLGSQGSQAKTSIKRHVNHQMDAFIAAYATYFDGVHSNDTQLIRTFRTASIWIEALRLSRQRHGENADAVHG